MGRVGETWVSRPARWVGMGVLDRFIPEEILRSPVETRRARSVVAGSLIASVLSVPLALSRLADAPRVALLLGVTALILGLLPFGLLLTRRVAVAAIGVPLTAWITLTWFGYLDGGLRSDAVLWFGMIPFVGGIFLRTRGCLVFTAMTALSATLLFADTAVQDGIEHSLILRYMATVGVVLFAGGVGWFYEQSHAREQEEMERVRDGFVSTVSHELRTPLTAIRGGLTLARSGVLGPEEAAEMLETAERNVKRLGCLVDDLLDLSRIQSGHLELKRERVHLAPLVQAAADELQSVARSAGVELVTQLQSDAVVFVDSLRFEQIMANLLSNAIKYSEGGSQVRVGLTDQGSLVRICVEDDGPGIPKEFRASVFERFSMADATTTKREGTGLGLAITKHLVEAFDGRIWFETETGVGTRFCVEFERLS